MGGSQSKEINENSDTINWNKIKTDNISSTLPNFNGLSNEAQNLIASLNIPQITESQASEFTINHIIDNISNSKQNDQYKFNQLLDQELSQNNQENDLSATSPFISSEMYNYLIKNESQKGGGNHNIRKLNNKKGGAKLDDDSDTSSTSSSSSDKDLIDSNESEVLENKKNKLNKKKNNKRYEKADSELSGGELSYLSSSAHTDGEFSDSHTAHQTSSQSSTTQDSHNSSSVSQSSNKSTVTDKNKYQSTSISVNTDDINMVSDY